MGLYGTRRNSRIRRLYGYATFNVVGDGFCEVNERCHCTESSLHNNPAVFQQAHDTCCVCRSWGAVRLYTAGQRKGHTAFCCLLHFSPQGRGTTRGPFLLRQLRKYSLSVNVDKLYCGEHRAQDRASRCALLWAVCCLRRAFFCSDIVRCRPRVSRTELS